MRPQAFKIAAFLSLLPVCWGNAYLTSPVPRTSAKWSSSGSRLYSYATYTRPANGIAGCSPGSTTTMCQTLETCDSTSIGSRTNVAEGGFLTVEWDCVAGQTPTDDMSASTGVSIAIKCGTGSFFSNVLSTHYNATCASSPTVNPTNAVAIPNGQSGLCTVLWAWELTTATGGFYMGCSDLAILPRNSNGGSDDVVTKEEINHNDTAAGIAPPVLLILAIALVAAYFQSKLPEWFCYVRYGCIWLTSLIAFGCGIASTSFAGEAEDYPFQTHETRYMSWLSFVVFLYSFLLTYAEYSDHIEEVTLPALGVSCVFVALFFVAGCTGIYQWWGVDDYCLYSNADTGACDTFRMLAAAQWILFCLFVCEVYVYFKKIMSDGSATRSTKAANRHREMRPDAKLAL